LGVRFVAVCEFEGCIPSIAANAYVHEDAEVLGDVEMFEKDRVDKRKGY
jgi:carbonic anhydrase/acetyltransferase-like protein (isoleucine patch superfamily)